MSNAMSYNHPLQQSQVIMYAPLYFWFSKEKFHQSHKQKLRQDPISERVL